MAHKAKKLAKQLEAWRKAMQKDLDRKNELYDKELVFNDEKAYPEVWRLENALNKAVEHLRTTYGWRASFSQGRQVVLEPEMPMIGVEAI